MKVDNNTYREYDRRESVPFTKREVDFIQNNFSIYNFFSNDKKLRDNDTKLRDGDFTQCVITSNKNGGYNIRKLVDEYYIAYRTGYYEFYLFDQFDELKEFLEGLKVGVIKESSLYKNISDDEVDLLYRKDVPFTNDEMDKFRRMSLDFNYLDVDGYGIEFTIPQSGKNDTYHVTKIDDEWYVIERFFYIKGLMNVTSSKYYKCDQWDGLMSYINDVLKGENINESLYEPIQSSDYLYKGDIIRFPSDERNKFIKMDKGGIFNFQYYQYCVEFELDDIKYNITRLEDEWYFIEKMDYSSIAYYKCDQWDGLVEFLMDVLKNHGLLFKFNFI